MKNGASIKILAEGKTNSKRKDLVLSHASHACPLKKPPSREIRGAGNKESLPFPAILVKY
jgi:hypothetical protein